LAIEDGTVTVVAYDGGAAQKQGLVSGEVDVFVGTTQAGMEEVEIGNLEAILAFSEEDFEGFKTANGEKLSVPGIGNKKANGLDASKDYTGSILPAGGFLAGRVGADKEWVNKVIEISKAVWNEPEYNEWINTIGLNRLEIYGDDAVMHLDKAIKKAIHAYDLLSSKMN
jgi:tripartite-type tricarboxylate transporter receptor subunit TctC